MPKIKLTDAGVKNLPCPASGQIDYFDTLLPAFGVRVSYGGRKTFFVTTRIGRGSKLGRFTVGRYPLLGLSDARGKARNILDLAARGIDPRKLRDSEIAENERKARQTFGAMADKFLTDYPKRKRPGGRTIRDSTLSEYRRTFEKTAAAWRSRPVADISRVDVVALLDGLESDGKPVMADRTFAYLRRFYRWLVDDEVLDASPLERIRRETSSVSRERVLNKQEIMLVMKGFGGLGYPFGPLFSLLLLTGQRKSEVAGMEWSELRDWSTKPVWDLPGSRTKNGRPHLVPIVPAAKAIVDACPRIGPHVFTTTGKTPVSGFSKAKAGVAANLPHWTLHDLRRTMATHMNERLGVLPHVVEAILNHASGAQSGVAGIYNRAQYLDERRAALVAWAGVVVEEGRHAD